MKIQAKKIVGQKSAAIGELNSFWLHKAVTPVRLEPAASRLKSSTLSITEPRRSHWQLVLKVLNIKMISPPEPLAKLEFKGGSRISGKRVDTYKGVGKQIFHLHRVFENGWRWFKWTPWILSGSATGIMSKGHFTYTPKPNRNRTEKIKCLTPYERFHICAETETEPKPNAEP